MAFVVKIYKTDSENNRVYKDLTDELTVGNCVARDELDIYTPVITIQSSQRLFDYNYYYIENFHRYYYVTDIKIVRNSLYEVSLRCDVLMSFKQYFEYCKFIVDRSEEFNSPYVADPDVVISDKLNYQIMMFDDNPLDMESYLLVTNGFYEFEEGEE